MIWTLTGFFMFVALAVVAAGLLWSRLHPASAEGSLGGGFSMRQWLLKLLVKAGEKIPATQRDPASERKQLFQAGYRGPQSIAFWRGTRWVVAGGLAVVALAVAAVVQGSLSESLLPMLCAGGFGYLLPQRILEWRTKARRQRIRSAVPSAVDLLVLATEAGQPLDQSMYDTAHSLAAIYPDLSSEFMFCQLEMRAGKSRAESLRHLAERSSEPELARLANLLLDGERFGTSLGPALRSHARFLRTRMRHKAQEAARKLGVKLVFPVFFLIFPSVLLVTLGPAYLQMRAFLGKLLNQ
ncbi:MAG: type II secretion system F family protein [Bryobacteraceae bacterium]